MVALRLHVGGIDEQTLLNQELEKLRQTGSVAAYNTEFNRLYPGDQIPFRYLHYLYSRGLAKDIQAYMPLLNNSSPPADLRGLQRNAITAESLVAQSKGALPTAVGRYSLASRQSQTSQQSSSSQGRSAVPKHPDAIDLDAALSPEERRKRRHNNQCFDCGETGHNAGSQACKKPGSYGRAYRKKQKERGRGIVGAAVELKQPADEGSSSSDSS